MRIPKVYRMFLSRGVPAKRIFPTKRFIVKQDPGYRHQALKIDHNTTQFLNMGFPSGNETFNEFCGWIIGIYVFYKSMPYVYDWFLDVKFAASDKLRAKIEARTKLEKEKKSIDQLKRQGEFDDE